MPGSPLFYDHGIMSAALVRNHDRTRPNHDGTGFSHYRLFCDWWSWGRFCECQPGHADCHSHSLSAENEYNRNDDFLLQSGFLLFTLWKKPAQYLDDPDGRLSLCRYHRTSVKRYIYIGLYGTSLSPIITQIMQIGDLAVFPRLLLCIVIGNLIGFVLPPLATHVSYAHKGYSLYNVGFAAGIIATIVMSVFKSFGITVESRSFWASGYNQLAACMLGGLFLVMILLAYWHERKQLFTHYRALLASPGVAGTGLSHGFWSLHDALQHGCQWAFCHCLCPLGRRRIKRTHHRLDHDSGRLWNHGQASAKYCTDHDGGLSASLTKDWSIQDPSAMLALLLSTNLAPVAGEFGVIAGLIAGFLHSSVALNVSVVYSGMNLYIMVLREGSLRCSWCPVSSILSRS